MHRARRGEVVGYSKDKAWTAKLLKPFCRLCESYLLEVRDARRSARMKEKVAPLGYARRSDAVVVTLSLDPCRISSGVFGVQATGQ